MGVPVRLDNVVVCFPHLFEPHGVPGSTNAPKYSVESILDPANPQHAAKLRELEAAFLQVLTEENKAQYAANLKRPWKDGNTENQRRGAQGKAPRDELTNRVFLRSSSLKPVPVVDAQVTPMTDPMQLFGGCICTVHVDLYWSSNIQNPGVYCGLNGVQLVSNVNVKRLGGGGPSVEQMFQPVAGAPAPVCAAAADAATAAADAATAAADAATAAADASLDG